MDEERIRELVTELAELVGAKAALVTAPATPVRAGGANSAADRLLSRIVLGDILDDSILSARPGDRTFPLRLFFSELGTMLSSSRGDDAADHAFTLASGLNFFFRAEMDGESKVRVALEVSRALYALADAAKMDVEMVTKASPLLAALMSGALERVKLESVDHMKVFDSQVHERTNGSDPTGSRIRRPASFLCRVLANNAVKAKAQVVT